MATTSPDNIRTPNPSDNFNLVADWATTASDVQAALIKRANMYVGTSAQRTAFTSAPEGVHWQDTNGAKLEWVRKSGQWVAPLEDTGWVDLTSSLSAGFRGSLRARRVGLSVEVLLETSPTSVFGSGSFVGVGTLSSEWRPTGGQNRRSICWFPAARVGFGYIIPSSGAVGIIQGTGASITATAEVNWTYTV